MSLLLISGKAGSGKDTMAQYIIDKYASNNTKIARLALADKLKQLTFMLLKEFNIEIDSIDDLYNIDTKNKYRTYLQHIGTECCRKIFGDDFWCEQLSKDIIAQVKNGVHVIVSDVRFTNELSYLYNVLDKHKIDGLVVSITISGRGYNNIDSKHTSELMNGFECDYVVENTTDVETFYNKIEHMLNESGLTELYLAKQDSVHHNIEVLTVHEYKPEPMLASTKPVEHMIEHNNRVLEFPSTVSSYALGRIGETDVAKTIERVRPDFEINIVSATGHLGDIHATDHNHNIKYLLEIKLKQNIVKDDIDKFNRDLELAKQNNPSYKLIGIFISLNSIRIPSIGTFKITEDTVFLTKDFFSEYILSILFSVIEVCFTNSSRTNNVITMQQTNKVEYIISPTVINLIVQLRAEYTKIKREFDLYKQMKTNTEDNLRCLTELMHDIIIKEQFISFLNTEFADILPTVDASVTNHEDQQLRLYIQTHSKGTIKKKELIHKFPSLSTKLGTMKLEDILDEYGKK